jgi:hypothetical protein
MKKLLFIFFFLFLIAGQLSAQLCTIAITSSPCMGAPGLTGVITASNCPGATYYQWQSMVGQVNSVWLNGTPAPIQSATPSVNLSFQSSQQYYVICVTAYSANDSSNTACDTIWGFIKDPVFASTNNTIGVPGDSGTYTVEPPTAGCALYYAWTLTGDVTFNNGSQSYMGPGDPGAGVNLNFGPNFTTGVLCVQAVSSFGVFTYTVCMTINASVGISDLTGSPLSFYYQPNLQQVALKFSAPTYQKISINSHDIAGRLVSQEQHHISPGIKEIFVSTAGFKEGLYFVEVTGTDFRKTLKIAVTD